MRWPNLMARDAGDPRVDNRMEYFEIDRLGDVIVRSQASCPQLTVTIGQRRQEHQGYMPEAGRQRVQPLQHLEPDMMGMLISHNSRSGMTLRIATKPSCPSCANDHIEAAIGKLLGDQSRNLTVVIDAKKFLASFGHPFAPTRNKESTRWGESYPTAFDPYLRAGRYTVKSPRGLCD